MQSLGKISLLVRDYDEAIYWYIQKLGFHLIEDTKLSELKRWVVVSPDIEGNGCNLLLAKAVGEEQIKAIGNQSGGRVFLFLYVTDFDAFYKRILENNIELARPIANETWGRVVVIKDLYGNLWDIIEKKQ